MNPRSTDCEADALTTTPSRRLKLEMAVPNCSSRKTIIKLIADWLIYIVTDQSARKLPFKSYCYEFGSKSCSLKGHLYYWSIITKNECLYRARRGCVYSRFATIVAL